MSQMTPPEIVEELNRHIIGQDDAKRSVAIALRIAGAAPSWARKCATKSRPKISS